MGNVTEKDGNRRDPVCGMTGTIEHHGYWFCSRACIQKFEARTPQQREWRASTPLGWLFRMAQDPVIWSFGLVGSILLAGRIWPQVHPVAHALWAYLSKTGWAIALGLVLGGIIDQVVPKEYISLWLSGHRRRMIFASASLGFLASACSHGCLALSMELYRKGASVPAVITFLLASPWASFSLTLLIISLMGVKGLLIVVMALLVALTTGFIFQQLERKGLLDANPHTVRVQSDFSIWKDFWGRVRRRRWSAQNILEDVRGIAQGTWALGRMVLFWVAVGFSLSAFLGTVVPQSWWARFLGPTVLGMATTMTVAALFEVCSEGTAPLAVELYRQTGALGNAFGFLMGGVITDFTELSAVWSNLGKKVVGWLLLVTLPQVFFWGMVMNWIGR